MNTPYLSDISNFKKISSSFIIAANISHELFLKCNSKKDALTIDYLFKELKILLKTIPSLPMDYFANYYERLKYEMVFDIYNSAIISSDKRDSKNTLKMKDYINQFLDNSGYKVTTDSLAQEISRQKRTLKDDLIETQYYRTTSRKFATFYNYVCEPLLDKGEATSQFLPPKDLVFNIRYYNHWIFSKRNYASGIQIFNFYNLIQEYFLYNKLDHTLSFDSEYSSYLFEFIHYPIQFQKCFCSCLNKFFSPSKKSLDSCGLLLYTKLFDTHYISLSDYILEKYKENLTAPDNYSLKQALYELQILDSFWLPIINMTIKTILFQIYNEDLNLISRKSRIYIEDFIRTNPTYTYSFRNMLESTSVQLEACEYPSFQKGNKHSTVKEDKKSLCKKVIDTKAPKTGSLEYDFNYLVSKFFYTKNVKTYLYDCVLPFSSICSLELCRQYTNTICEHYSNSANLENVIKYI